jgi:hypothetical protein
MFVYTYQQSGCQFYNNMKVQSKERMTGIKISCKHYRSLYIFREKSNAPKLQALYIKYCTIFMKVIKYVKPNNMVDL